MTLRRASRVPSLPALRAHTCIHRSSTLSSCAQTISLHLAFLASAVSDARKSSFSNNLERSGKKKRSLVPLILHPGALAGLWGGELD